MKCSRWNIRNVDDMHAQFRHAPAPRLGLAWTSVTIRIVFSYFVTSVLLLGGAICGGAVHAQAFVNDNDGLLDVGESPLFPAAPHLATGVLDLTAPHGGGPIEDLDGVSLLTNVEELKLRHNLISSVEPGDFISLPNLRSLELSHNSITSVEQGDFQGLSNLETLRLSFNEISSIEPGDFTSMPNLRELRLTRNSITSVEQGDFRGLSNLETLILSSNEISSIESGDFDGLSNLWGLAMDGNSISRIAPGAFDQMENLTVLELSHNPLTVIEARIFSGLPNLEILYLGSLNGIPRSSDVRAIGPGAFAGTRNLKLLNLDNTNLTELNLTRATFELEGVEPGPPWRPIQNGISLINVDVTSLVLNDAELSLGWYQSIIRATPFITDVSMTGLTFTDQMPSDLSNLLGISTLNNVRIDSSLYGQYSTELDAFAALPGNAVTVVPEPSTVTLLLLAGVVCFFRRRFQGRSMSRFGTA